jgi:hypothetical protein
MHYVKHKLVKNTLHIAIQPRAVLAVAAARLPVYVFSLTVIRSLRFRYSDIQSRLPSADELFTHPVQIVDTPLPLYFFSRAVALRLDTILCEPALERSLPWIPPAPFPLRPSPVTASEHRQRSAVLTDHRGLLLHVIT